MRTIAIAQKVIKELLRDKRTLALMFVAPVFIMWLMNLMFSASTTVNVKLATQDLPTSLVSRMDDLDHVSVKTYKDLDQAKEALNDEKVDAVISYKDGEYHVDYANTDASKTSVTRQVLRTSMASEGTSQLVTRVKQALPQLKLDAKSPEIKESYEYGNEDTGFFAKNDSSLDWICWFSFCFLDFRDGTFERTYQRNLGSLVSDTSQTFGNRLWLHDILWTYCYSSDSSCRHGCHLVVRY